MTEFTTSSNKTTTIDNPNLGQCCINIHITDIKVSSGDITSITSTVVSKPDGVDVTQPTIKIPPKDITPAYDIKITGGSNDCCVLLNYCLADTDANWTFQTIGISQNKECDKNTFKLQGNTDNKNSSILVMKNEKGCPIELEEFTLLLEKDGVPYTFDPRIKRSRT